MNPASSRAPTRVVSLIASSTETICALGCGDRLVGRSHECDHPAWVQRLPVVTSPKFETDGASYAIDQRVRAIVEQGLSVYRVDAAAMAALEPDLIVTQVQCEVCAVSLRDLEEACCATLASRPLVVALEPNGLEELWRDIGAVAAALGVADRGATLVEQLKHRMKAIAETASHLTARPRVALIEWIEPLMAAGNWHPDLIAMAGGVDRFGAPGVHAPWITWEALRDSDPDVVVIAPCGFNLARTADELGPLIERPGWDALRAVREGRVVIADGNAFFNRPGPRVVETLEILAEVIHPDAFAFGHQGTGWVGLAAAAALGSAGGAGAGAPSGR